MPRVGKAALKPKFIDYSTQKRPKSRYGKFGEPLNNYFQMPSCFLQAKARGVFQGRAEELMVELVMQEEWSGFGEQMRKGATISLPEFAARLAIDERSAQNGAKRLVEVGIFERIGTSISGRANCYHVNLAAIEGAAPYVYEPPKLAIVPKPEPAAPVTRHVIPPGKTGRIPFPIPVPGTDEWIESIVGVKNTATIPLSLAATRIGRDVQLEIENAEEEPSTPVIQFREQKAKTDATKRLTDFRPALKTLLKAYFGEPVNDQIVKRVAEAAGPELPASEYLAYADKKVAARIKSGREMTTGILVEFAKDCRARWNANADDRAAEAVKTAKLKVETDRVARENAFDATGDETAWPTIRKALRPQMTDANYQNWFVSTRGEGVSSQGTLLVTVPAGQTAAFLAEEYGELVNRTAQAVDASIERVQFWAAGRQSEASHG